MNAASVLGIGLVFTLKDEVSNAASKMTQKFQQLNYVSTETAAKMESSLKGIGTGFKMMGAGAALLAPLGLAISKSMDFNKAISAVGAVSNATAQDLAKLKTQAMALGESTAFTAVQVAEAQKFLSMAGFSVNDTLAATPGMLSLAAAGNIDLARAADIASNAMGIFQMKATDANIMSDILAKTATSSNTTIESLGESIKYFAGAIGTYKIPLEEASAAIGLLGNNGLQGSVATTALSTAFARLSKPTSEMQKAMKETGTAFFKDGNFIGMTGVLQEVERATASMNQEQKAAYLNTMFGAMATKNMVALLGAEYKTMENGVEVTNRGSAALANYTKTIEGAAGSADKMADMQLNNLAGSFTKLQSATDGFLIRIGDKLEPIVKKMVDGFTSLVGVMSSVANSPLGDFLVGLTATVGVGLVALGGFVSAFHTVKFAMMALQPVLVMLKGAFISTLIPLLPYIAVAAAVGAAIYGLVKAYQSFSNVLSGQAAPANGFLGVMQKIGGAIHTVIAIWKSATSEGFTLSGELYKALQSVGLGEFALNIGTYIVRIKAFFEGASSRFENLKNVFGSVWEAFGRVGKAFEPIIDLLAKAGFSIDKLGGDVSVFSALGGYAFDFLTLSIRGIAVALELVANYVTFALEGFMIFYNFVTNTFSQINGYIDQFKNGFISLPQLFGKIGLAITNNLLTGIKAGWSSITSFLVNSLKALPGGEAIASYFGIGEDSGEAKAKTAAVSQTGIAGVGVSDTEVAPSQANSSFSKKVDNINNASVTKAQQSAETSKAMQTMASSGIASTGQSNTQQAPTVNVTVELDGEKIQKSVNVRNELDDARS